MDQSSSTTPVSEAAASPKGVVSVRRLTDQDVVTRMTAAVAELLRSAGTDDLAEAVRRAQDWELDAEGAAALSEIEAMAYLGALPTTLSCCAGCDDGHAAAFVAAVQQVVESQQLPPQDGTGS